MSKGIAVAGAIANQLHHEGRWPPNDLNKVMGTDYLYNKNTLANFLTAVKWNLEHGTPPYFFTFDNDFAKKALAFDVAQLIGEVSKRTTDKAPKP